MKEFKECVSFYSELFSKHEENEEYDDVYITPRKKLKNISDTNQEEQDLWFSLKECGVKINTINHYIILFNELNIDKKHSFLCELAEKIEENKDEITTTDFVLRRLLAYMDE